MLLALCILQGSILVRPVILDETPPPVRAAQTIELVHAQSPGVQEGFDRTREQAAQLAGRIHAELLAGADFGELVTRYSESRNKASGSYLGSFVPGALPPELDRFLFSAEMGACSAPIVLNDAVYLVRRVEPLAGCLRIHVAGTDADARKRSAAVLAALEEGRDFGDVARELSSDRASAERGGQYQIFERGPRDTLLKGAVFGAAVGEIVGPIEALDGFHFVQRVAPETMDPSLRELTLVRLRAILIAHDESVEGVRRHDRAGYEAATLARELHERILAGEDMAALAAQYTDDLGGRERSGDLGWVHRRSPGLPRFIDRAFLQAVGVTAEPVGTSAGYLILRRER